LFILLSLSLIFMLILFLISQSISKSIFP